MDKKRFSIIKFVEVLQSALREFPRYFSKFSQKTYTNIQIISLRTLKEVLNISYETLISLIDDFPELKEVLRLKRIPYGSTICRRSNRIDSKRIESLLHKSSRKKRCCIAVDATGFENHHASRHYCRTIKLRFSRRQYVKLSIAIDTQTQLICAQKSRNAPRNDNIDFVPLLSKIKDPEIQMVCADKGYDSRSNRKFVFKTLKAIPNIPKRSTTGHDRFTRMFDEKTYHQRSKVETVFSVMKKLFGSALRSVKLKTQKTEILYKCLAYNTRRFVISPNLCDL